MSARPLHIAWLGPAPGQDGGVPGVAADLLGGLAALGHRIDCFFPSAGHQIPARLADVEGLSFHWGTAVWEWDRWYSRTRVGAFLSGLAARALASLRLRQKIADFHARDPFDVIYQFSNIENLAVSTSLARAVPLVIHPETHIAGELRSLWAERRLSLRCSQPHTLAIVAATMLVRAFVQRARIRRASLLVCISGVFRDRIVRDYGFPAQATTVVPNPVRLARFEHVDVGRPPAQPPRILVLGRVALRKGVEDVVAAAQLLTARGVDYRMRVVGGPSLWSDYTKLLDDLPARQCEYVGSIPAEEVPAELAASDVLLQASKYEPFALTVAEALAAGVTVVATSEVGAIERVSEEVGAVLAPGDAAGLADGVGTMLERLADDPAGLRATARAEAQRLFDPELVCRAISEALEGLVGERAR